MLKRFFARKLIMLLALFCLTSVAFAAEARVRGTPARFEGALKIKEMTAPGTPASGFVYVYMKSDGLIYIKDDAGTETSLTAAGGQWGSSGTDITLADNDDDLLLDDGTTISFTDGNPGTADVILARAAAGILSLSGAATLPGTIRILEDTDNGAHYVEFKAAASLAGNVSYTLPTVAHIGRTANPARTLFATLSSAGQESTAPSEVVLYQSLTASAAHTGSTAAETSVMPATDEGTGDTDLAAWLLTGASLPWHAFVRFTGDADGDETLTVNVYAGATLIGTSGAVAVDGGGEICLDGLLTISAGGATGTGDFSCKSFTAAAVAMDGADIGSTDFTAVTPFDIKLDWGGTTDAADSATVQVARITANNVD